MRRLVDERAASSRARSPADAPQPRVDVARAPPAGRWRRPLRRSSCRALRAAARARRARRRDRAGRRAEGQPRDGARDVGRRPQRARADPRAASLALDQEADRIEAGGDRLRIAQRAREPGRQLARARPRHRAVDGGEQAAVARSPTVERSSSRLARLAASMTRIVGRRRRGAAAGSRACAPIWVSSTYLSSAPTAASSARVKRAEAAELGDAELRLQARARRPGCRSRRRRPASPPRRQPRASCSQAGVAEQRVGGDHLAGRQPHDLAGEIGAPRTSPTSNSPVEMSSEASAIARLACRRAAVARAKQRGQVVARLGVEQAVLGQRAGRDEAHDVAAHHRLGAALPRFGRVLELLADGDAVALPDQPLQVFVGAMRPARRTSGCPRPGACRAWSARCRAPRRRPPRPRRTARRSRPSGTTGWQSGLAALISRNCAIDGRGLGGVAAARRGRRAASRGSRRLAAPPCVGSLGRLASHCRASACSVAAAPSPCRLVRPAMRIARHAHGAMAQLASATWQVRSTRRACHRQTAAVCACRRSCRRHVCRPVRRIAAERLMQRPGNATWPIKFAASPLHRPRKRCSSTPRASPASSRSRRPSRWRRSATCRSPTRRASPCRCWPSPRTRQLAYDYTNKGNLVAVVSNGTAILGLGNLGALAAKPVMEGKGALFKRFADIDAHRPAGRHRGRRRLHQLRALSRPDLRRHQPRGHQGAGLLHHRGEAQGAARHPGLPRRPARHRHHRRGRPHQCARADRARHRRRSSSSSTAPAPPASPASICWSPMGMPQERTSSSATPRASSTRAARTA